MANSQNDIDIYYAVGNANTKRQENEISAIFKISSQPFSELLLNQSFLVISTTYTFLLKTFSIIFLAS